MPITPALKMSPFKGRPGGLFFFIKALKEFAAKEKLEIVKERGEPVFAGEPQDYGGFSSPPAVAKCVRIIFRIEHLRN